MKELHINLTISALTVGLVFCITALAEGLTKDSYKADKESIVAEYKADKSACSAMSGNQKDICVAQAKGKEKVALAELEANYPPTAKNQHQVRIAKAEADYAVARERCDDKAGNAKDVCIKEAKAAEAAAKADATAAMK